MSSGQYTERGDRQIPHHNKLWCTLCLIFMEKKQADKLIGVLQLIEVQLADINLNLQRFEMDKMQKELFELNETMSAIERILFYSDKEEKND